MPLFSLLLLSSCKYTQKIKDGNTAMDRKQYSVAVILLKKEYDKEKSRVEKGKKAFLLGQAYSRLGKPNNAIPWYAIAYDNQYGIEALERYAFSLKEVERYDDAIQAFKDLGNEIGSPYEYRREIKACQVARKWVQKEQTEARVEAFAGNDKTAEYSPAFYGDNQLVFTSDRAESEGDKPYMWTGRSFSDLFVKDLTTGEVSSFSSVLNSEYNEGTITFNSTFDEAYFTRCFAAEEGDAFCHIMYSKKEAGNWTEPRQLSFFEGYVNEVQPCLSPSGNELYFAADHPDGWGGYDIYYVEKEGLNGWSEPKILGRTINSTGNEKFPTMDHDTMYFSSDYFPGMGGLDIFKTYKLASGKWSSAVNVKSPLNSGADDFGLVLMPQDRLLPGVTYEGYFSSNRNGSDDVLMYTKMVAKRRKELDTIPLEYKWMLDGFIVEKIFENPDDPNSKYLGRKPIDGAMVDIAFDGQIKKIKVGKEGAFSIELQEEMDYIITASKEGYLKNKVVFSTKGIGRDPQQPEQRFEVEVILGKIFHDQEIVLEDIYYDFNRANIRKDAEPTLNELAKILKLNPSIKIELGSHTDCRGNDEYNANLSQQRAQSVVDYLQSKGIANARLFAKGYGESNPAVNCKCSQCTEQDHQRNRRTTFKIVE